ncbi:hypothetical protein Ahy_A01g001065 isoform D [Arachis hypogaea]|uniref:Uncharacterized protein n=1 Tax=Arachis hypogaea TaxID=3818 RepID=A0A445EM90_ARAHY|nr:hypothetical protein Ahy_A01g001065 isoform D [Arachis hypogaea]
MASLLKAFRINKLLPLQGASELNVTLVLARVNPNFLSPPKSKYEQLWLKRSQPYHSHLLRNSNQLSTFKTAKVLAFNRLQLVFSGTIL